MTWLLIFNCQICGATEHRIMQDDEEATKHVCRASLVGEGKTSL